MPRRLRIPARRRVLLACEGHSERAYGVCLYRLSNQRGLHIHIDAWLCDRGGGDLLYLANAVERRLHAEASRGRPYAVKALLFDVDRLGQDIARDTAGMAILRRWDVRLIRQDVNHEAFLLRHIDGCAALRPPAQTALQELQRRWPDYQKGVPADYLLKRIDQQAISRAAAVEADLADFLELLRWSA